MTDRRATSAPSPPDLATAIATGHRYAPEADVDREFTVEQRSQAKLVIQRFIRHRLAVASLIVFLGLVALAWIGGAVWPYEYDQYTKDESQPPSLQHPFGTDAVGKDELALVLRGTKRSIGTATIIAIVSTAFGTIWGATAGFYRGALDSVMMRITDLVLTLPLIAVGAVLAHMTEGTWWLVGLVIGGLYWAYVSRVVRGVVLSLREQEFIEAAKALGATDARIIFRHLVPNAMGTIIVNVTILVAIGVLLETALSYLGFGVQPPDTSLGLLVSESQTAVSTRPWLFYFPGLFIVIIALTINFIGDGLRDAFDPGQTRVRQ